MRTVLRNTTLLMMTAMTGFLLTACNNAPEVPETPKLNNGISVMNNVQEREVIQRSGYDFETMEQHAIFYQEDKVMLILYGSSSCKPTPEKVFVEENVLNVELKSYNGDPCTADYGPAVWSVDIPDYGISTSDNPKVQLRTEGSEIMIESTVAYPNNT